MEIMSRRVKFFCVIAGVVIFAIIMRHNKVGGEGTKSPVIQVASTPQPAAEPTVAAPVPKKTKAKARATPSSPKHRNKGKPSHGHSSKPAKADLNSRETSESEVNLSKDLQLKLKALVTLYASWPGSTPKQELIKQLKQKEPFITAEAVKKIETEWKYAPQTVKLTVKSVDFATGLTAAPKDRNQGVVEAYVQLVKHFTPVSGNSYTQLASQPYTVKMRIINRVWRVVGISTQNAASSTGG
jgi:hypothetical protein